MKLIIDIDEVLYKIIRNDSKTCVANDISIMVIENAIYNGTPLKEWLSSFNTDSAPICFNKIQELKRECEKYD